MIMQLSSWYSSAYASYSAGPGFNSAPNLHLSSSLTGEVDDTYDSSTGGQKARQTLLVPMVDTQKIPLCYTSWGREGNIFETALAKLKGIPYYIKLNTTHCIQIKVNSRTGWVCSCSCRRMTKVRLPECVRNKKTELERLNIKQWWEQNGGWGGVGGWVGWGSQL